MDAVQLFGSSYQQASQNINGFGSASFGNTYEHNDVEKIKTESVKETFNTSVATVADFVGNLGIGVLDTAENIFKGTGMIVLGDICCPILDWIAEMDTDKVLESSEWGEIDLSYAGEASEKLKESLTEFFNSSWTDGLRKKLGENEYIQEYSSCSETVNGVAEGIGSMAGYIIAGSVPYVGPILVGAGTAGNATEQAFNCGATFEDAQVVSAVAGIAGLVTDGVLELVGNAAKAAKTIGGALGYTAVGAAAGEIEPLANAVVQWFTYGKDNYDSFDEFWKSNGYTLEAILGAAGGAIRTLLKALGGEAFKKKEEVAIYHSVEDIENDIVNKLNSKYGTDLEFDELKKLYPDEVKQMVYDNYTAAVVDDKYTYELKKIKKELENCGKKWDDLSLDEQHIYEKEATIACKNLADETIGRVEYLVDSGYVKPEYTSDDIIKMIEDNVSPETYLTDYAIADYYSNFHFDADGNTKVYTFQSGDVYANNTSAFGGNVGRSEGLFAMPEDDYLAIINNRNIFDENGNCINIPALEKELGGVDLGTSVIAIEQTVNQADIKMPNGSLDGAFLGDWHPGGKTSNGITECLIPQSNFYENPNMVLICHSDSFDEVNFHDNMYYNYSKNK